MPSIRSRVCIRRPSRDSGRPLVGLDAAFEGRRGTVVDVEKYGRSPSMYRVRLDEPVVIEGVGRVTDDLWSGEYLRKTTR